MRSGTGGKRTLALFQEADFCNRPNPAARIAIGASQKQPFANTLIGFAHARETTQVFHLGLNRRLCSIPLAVDALYPRIPFVLTGRYGQMVAQYADYGLEFLQKPYSVEALSRVLSRAMRNRRNGSADNS